VRILRVDERRRSIEIVPENTLDLLNLFRFIQQGDIIYSTTTREMKKERADGSYDSERVKVRIAIEVEKKTLEPMVRRVSFLGRIIYESRDAGLEGKYHSIHVSQGMQLTVENTKAFPRLRAFASHYKRAEQNHTTLLLVLVDDEGVAVMRLGAEGVKVLLEKKIPPTGKHSIEERTEAVSKLYARAAEELEKQAEQEDGRDVEIAVFGPDVFVSEYLNYLKREKKELLRLVKFTGSSSGGKSGLDELLRGEQLRGYAERIKVIADAEQVERLIAAMARNPETVAIGLEECIRAAEMGAVDTLLVAEDYLWEHLSEERVEALLKLAEETRASVQVISPGLEAADKLNALGGVAAILRYALAPSS